MLVIGLGISLVREFQTFVAILYAIAVVAGLIASRVSALRWQSGLLGGGVSVTLYWLLVGGLVAANLFAGTVSPEDPEIAGILYYAVIFAPLCVIFGFVAGWLAMDLRRHLESA